MVFNGVTFPLIKRSPTPPDGILPNAVESAFEIAMGKVEQPAPTFVDLQGRSGRRYRVFANALMKRVLDPRYLEVGIGTGSTLCSAIAGNGGRFVAVDNGSQFGGLRDRLIENLGPLTAIPEVILVEQDFRAVAFAELGRFNVYMFDGTQSAIDHHDGLTLVLPALDAEFVFIVGNWNWAEVRSGTRGAVEELGLEIVYAIEVRTTADDTQLTHCGFEATTTDWHNGCFIAVLRKPVKPVPIGSRFGTAIRSRWMRLAAERQSSKTRANAERYASNPSITEVLALITHYYVPERLQWLVEVLGGLADLGACRTHALIVTNTAEAASLADIRNAALVHTTVGFSTEVVTALPLLHPHFLPWAQKPLIAERFLSGGSTFTHVVSLEDDIFFGSEGFCYWLQYRPPLAAHGLIPSFMRTEMRRGDSVAYATDATAANSLRNRPSVRAGMYTFVPLDNPYCAMFVLDRALAREYSASRSFHMGASMSFSPWGTRERAAMGLCWENPPPGFPVRYVLPVDEAAMSVAPCSYVRHLPGNYTNDPATPFGKVPADAVLIL